MEGRPVTELTAPAPERLRPVCPIGSNSVAFIDTQTNTTRHITYVGRSPHEAFFTPDGSEVWVTVRGENYIEHGGNLRCRPTGCVRYSGERRTDRTIPPAGDLFVRAVPRRAQARSDAGAGAHSHRATACSIRQRAVRLPPAPTGAT
jgi:hypothetical protein